jgi:hypothetical protein
MVSLCLSSMVVASYQSLAIVHLSLNQGVSTFPLNPIPVIDSDLIFTIGDLVNNNHATNILAETFNIILMGPLTSATTSAVNMLPEIIMVGLHAAVEVNNMGKLMAGSVILFSLIHAGKEGAVPLNVRVDDGLGEVINAAPSPTSNNPHAIITRHLDIVVCLGGTLLDVRVDGRGHERVIGLLDHVVDGHVFEYMSIS